MSKATLALAGDTPAGWAEYILERFDEFLIDHANCERKASALAMSMVVKYADREKLIPPLIELAQEELEHFRQVYEVMAARNLRLAADEKDPYVNALLALCKSGRQDRFLDRMLISSIIETRGAERFRLLQAAMTDPNLKNFYRGLWACEAKHGNIFVTLALEYVPAEELYPRLAELLEQEGQLIQTLPWRASLH